MVLTLADIERWDAGSVREVFHAASSRAQAAQDAANGLAALPAFQTWGGVAAEAARAAIGKTRRDLDVHGKEALAVANAARSAADEIEHLKSELATLKAHAEHMGMEIDMVTGRVLPGRHIRDPVEALLKEEQLQPRVDKIIAEANMIDFALANAMHMADGSTPIPVADESARPTFDAPVPKDPSATANGEGATGDPGAEPLGQIGPFAVPKSVADAARSPTGGSGGDPGRAPTPLDATLTPSKLTDPNMPKDLNQATEALAPGLSAAMARQQQAALGRVPSVADLKADPKVMDTVRGILTSQGVPADGMDAAIDRYLQGTHNLGELLATTPVSGAPTGTAMPWNPTFLDGVTDSLTEAKQGFEQTVGNLTGLGGPGAPGVADSWKNMATGIFDNPIVDPKGYEARHPDEPPLPRNAYEWGRGTADVGLFVGSAVLGPEALAGRGALTHELLDNPGLVHHVPPVVEHADVGPGAWSPVSESMSARSEAYQTQITGRPITDGYVVNGVKFDGFSNGVLTDAKGYYGQFIDNGQWRTWFRGDQALLDQAARQVAAAGSAPIQWTFAEKTSADLVREMLMDDFPQIRVMWVPPR